ncbi:hypothetical protein DSO57_1032574 [Entomophthora muscae]|uniref:Uncharacterized protein n=1 Tax=Entomophthora muscae TaxID=34485 RepID=A0ACC2TME5_9FUNG|nr:hypothetical protein DSO57_1032574 [Entomophthora muscae]
MASLNSLQALIVLLCRLLASLSSTSENLLYFEYARYSITSYNGSMLPFAHDSPIHMTINNFNQTLHLHLNPNTHLLHTGMSREAKAYLLYRICL